MFNSRFSILIRGECLRRIKCMRLSTIVHLRCPVCDNATIFHGYFDTPSRCPVCGYFFMRESGYFLPHVAIGYGVTVLVALSVWPLMQYVFGVRSDALIL